MNIQHIEIYGMLLKQYVEEIYSTSILNNTYLRKVDRSQINLSFCLKILEKKKQVKDKGKTRKKIIEIKAEINKIENK